jgi:hypothetical protein
MLGEAPVIPIYHLPTGEVRHSGLGGWDDNSLDLHPLKYVYLEDGSFAAGDRFCRWIARYWSEGPKPRPLSRGRFLPPQPPFSENTECTRPCGARITRAT